MDIIIWYTSNIDLPVAYPIGLIILGILFYEFKHLISDDLIPLHSKKLDHNKGNQTFILSMILIWPFSILGVYAMILFYLIFLSLMIPCLLSEYLITGKIS